MGRDLKNYEHGRRTTYTCGCRCSLCRTANTEAQARRRAKPGGKEKQAEYNRKWRAKLKAHFDELNRERELAEQQQQEREASR